VRLRQGDPRAAFVQFQKAAQADLCNARAYYGVAEIDGLAGMHASSKRMIEQAYKLHPTDDDINTAWIDTLPRKERLPSGSTMSNTATRSAKRTGQSRRRAWRRSLSITRRTAGWHQPRRARRKCRWRRVTDGPTRFIGWGLDVKLNGKVAAAYRSTPGPAASPSRARRRCFSEFNAKTPRRTGGIGDKGIVKTSVTHVASIKIGGIEFTNCAVEILEKWSVLDSDGLIGGNVFDDSLLTLDFPKHELRIAPLPLRPGETDTDRAKLEARGTMRCLSRTTHILRRE